MTDPAETPQQTPPTVERVLSRFSALGREERMQALVTFARRLEPVPPHFLALQDESFNVPECQTPVRLFPEMRDGRIHFYADIDTRRSPTVAAFLSVLFSAVNDQPPEVVLQIPRDFVRVVMQSMGLGTREVGLDALVHRVKRLAREALSDDAARFP
ncbi:MAG TPA: SufE family protein [Gemmatimonadaceae bacterium]|nr:SufE family protein [Gemmatimonadaceae bacterium]